MELERIVLAVTDMSAMVAFYNEVFGSELEPIGEPDSFHRGTLLGMDLLLCPNEIPQVDARQNRNQFTIRVSDLDAVTAAVIGSAGVVLSDDSADGRRTLGVEDPDGNTYEFVGPAR